ncbi:CPBP family intramembrane glutamic endopeptidase [Natrarchaeobius chitinivorans]|uniref:CPBP family intramembrane metalloprotease n=1 Tax=Natrarchaeobius chitinivorans TaxID=1679083 RepID=A0A3N6LRM2_NATCH|nr:type II CAAX endopeptidase family protein [Natrarchaeobius chitinivorans]RQG92418.1 CPBP family intramembrane metalloprotease [Natrarchaeobius chitinivorans]
MTETARSDAVSVPSAVVPGIGIFLSAVVLATLFVPVNRGVDDPAIWASVGFATVATLAFLVGATAVANSRTSGWIGAASSTVVVLLVGYALNQGITAPVSVPLVSTPAPLLFATFCVAGLATGIGAAYAVGVDITGLVVRSAYTALLSAVGAVGLVSAQFATLFLLLPIVLAAGMPSMPQFMVLSQIGMAVGTGVVAGGYLLVRQFDLSYIDLEIPSKRDVLWTVGGIIVLFGALFVISTVFYTTGVESSDHGTAQQAEENPEILLVLIPASLLVIGPFEELLYRNVIQKSLYETFSRYGAVVVGSVIFAAVHVLAYATAGVGEVIASLGVVFGLSIVLGIIYERTENLVVPALIHGAYNAILFANLYLSVA